MVVWVGDASRNARRVCPTHARRFPDRFGARRGHEAAQSVPAVMGRDSGVEQFAAPRRAYRTGTMFGRSMPCILAAALVWCGERPNGGSSSVWTSDCRGRRPRLGSLGRSCSQTAWATNQLRKSSRTPSHRNSWPLSLLPSEDCGHFCGSNPRQTFGHPHSCDAVTFVRIGPEGPR